MAGRLPVERYLAQCLSMEWAAQIDWLILRQAQDEVFSIGLPAGLMLSLSKHEAGVRGQNRATIFGLWSVTISVCQVPPRRARTSYQSEP